MISWQVSQVVSVSHLLSKKIAIVLLTTYATEKVVDMTKKNMGETAGQVVEIASDLI